MKPLIVRAHKYAKADPDVSTHASRYNGYIRGALDERKKFAWLPIDRDDNGFATEECTKEVLKHLPVVIRGYDKLGEYHHLITEDSIECDRMAILKFETYTHYLLIPKLEV